MIMLLMDTNVIEVFERKIFNGTNRMPNTPYLHYRGIYGLFHWVNGFYVAKSNDRMVN
jgi:hypothetical protein